MSCRMPKYCRGDRFLEEDGNCGLFFFAVDRTALSSGELDIRNPPKFFEDVLFVSDCIAMDWLTEGFEHGRWTRLPKESRRYGETWTGSASAVMVIVHARTHAHREHADVPSTSGKSFCLSRRTPSTCPNTEKKKDSGKGEIISMECSSSHSQCESVAKSCSEAMMKLRADGSGGGQAVLNFVGLGAELIGQATGWKEWACGSAVSSLKRKKSSVTEQLTVFECLSQELRWVLRGIFITQWTVFRSDLRISRDNYVVNLMPLCLSRAGFLVTSITFTTWCSLAVTIHCATISGSMWLWTYSRVELESCHFFFNFLLEWSVPLTEIFLANDI